MSNLKGSAFICTWFIEEPDKAEETLELFHKTIKAVYTIGQLEKTDGCEPHL